MPLSRGTAAAGYMVIISLFLSVDLEIRASTPAGLQVDWEAILGPTPDEFIEVIGRWMFPARHASSLLDRLPSVSAALPTLRHLIAATNCKMPASA